MDNIIPKFYNEIEVFFDKKENNLLYLNATKVAQKFGKEVKEWKRLPSTTEYIDALAKVGLSPNGKLIITKKGGNDKSLTGTWIHKKLIILFARWLSPEFAVWCDQQIEEILSEKYQQPQQREIDFSELLEKSEALLKLIKFSTENPDYQLAILDNYMGKDSPLKLLGIDFSQKFFIPTELGKMVGKSPVEINRILEFRGYQIKVDGVWQLSEKGKLLGIEVGGKFSQLKWKLEAIL